MLPNVSADVKIKPRAFGHSETSKWNLVVDSVLSPKFEVKFWYSVPSVYLDCGSYIIINNTQRMKYLVVQKLLIRLEAINENEILWIFWDSFKCIVVCIYRYYFSKRRQWMINCIGDTVHFSLFNLVLCIPKWSVRRSFFFHLVLQVLFFHSVVWAYKAVFTVIE